MSGDEPVPLAVDDASAEGLERDPKITKKVIIDGWNYKSRLASSELSQFIPFIDLIALYKESDTADDPQAMTVQMIEKIITNTRAEGQDEVDDIYNKRLISFKNRLKWYEIRNDESGLFSRIDDKLTIVEKNGFIRGINIASTMYKYQLANPSVTPNVVAIGGPGTDGLGIVSLETERGTNESFTMTFNIKMFLRDPHLISEFIEYLSLITLNSLFLVNYGWIPPTSFQFKSNLGPPSSQGGGKGSDQSGATVYDVLPDKNNCYYSSYICKLWKYDISYDKSGGMDISIDLMTPHLATLSLIRVSSVQSSMLKFINAPILVKNVPGNDIGKLKDVRTINIKMTDEGQGIPYISTQPDQGVTETESATKFVSIWWFIMAIQQAMSEASMPYVPMEPQNIPLSVQSEFSQTVITFFDTNEVIQELRAGDRQTMTALLDLSQSNISTNITNVGGIFLEAEAVKGLFTGSTTLLDAIAGMVDCIAFPGTRLLLDSSNNSIIRITLASFENIGMTTDVDATDISARTVDDGKIFTINYGAANSLCESISMESNLDPNAWETYQLPAFAGGNVIDTLGNMINLGVVDGEKVKEELSALIANNSETDGGTDADAAVIKLKELLNDKEKTVEMIIREVTGLSLYRYGVNSGKLKVNQTNRVSIQKFTTAIQNYMLKDMKKYVITNALSAAKGSKDLFGTLMGYYLKRTTVVIHGTTGINAYNYIKVKGLFPGVEGIYSVIKINDDVDQSGFTTTLECILIKPG